MSILLLFKYLTAGAALSFVGSLPFGLINISCSKISLQKGLKAALWFALGAALIETLQSFLSIHFAEFFIGDKQYNKLFSLFSIGLFILLGIYYFFFAKASDLRAKQALQPNKGRLLLRGAIVSSLNFMVFPYWIFYYSFLKKNAYLDFQGEGIFLFSIGVGIGTFLLLYLYSAFAQSLLKRFSRLDTIINRMIAFIFFGLAILSALQV